MIYEKYIVFRCPRCGKWQERENRKWLPLLNDEQKNHLIQKMVLECSTCKKYYKFHDKRKGGSRVEHYWFSNKQEAAAMEEKLAVEDQQWKTSKE